MKHRRCRFPSARARLVCLPAAVVLIWGLLLTMSTLQSSDGRPPRRPPQLRPFLEEFLQPSTLPITAEDVQWPTADGFQTGYLVRPVVEERLPAVLLLSDRRGLHDWLKQSARELSGVGYVVLAVDVPRVSGGVRPSLSPAVSTPMAEMRREQVMARLTAAIRWLHRKPYVDPERSSAIGFEEGAGWALAVAADQKLQACVTLDGPVASDPALLSGLRHTAVLTIWSGQHARTVGQKKTDAFRRALKQRGIENEFLIFEKAESGFLEPSRKAVHRFGDAERAWVILYEFLGTHAEDAPVKALLASQHPAGRAASTNKADISDLMLAVNTPGGVRGRLLKLLSQPPPDARTWREVRARAAVLVETAKLLERLSPHRGTRAAWRKHVGAYRTAAAELLEAAKRQNAKTARPALERLGTTCTACHRAHR